MSAPPPETVHVWLSRTDMPEAALTVIADELPAEERERAARILAPRARAGYVVAHAMLRQVLADSLGESLGSIRLAIGRHGKPALVGPVGLRFNLSHAGDLAAVAMAQAHEVGIDVAEVVSGFPWRDLADRFLSKGEVAAIEALPHGVQAEAFYACWARKEAVAKACGLGLALPAQDYTVSVGPAKPPSLIVAAPGLACLRRLWLAGVPVPDGYHGCVAVESTDARPRVRVHEWRPRQWVADAHAAPWQAKA